MIKIAVENHWGAANEIVKDVRRGKSFLESGLSFLMNICLVKY